MRYGIWNGRREEKESVSAQAKPRGRERSSLSVPWSFALLIDSRQARTFTVSPASSAVAHCRVALSIGAKDVYEFTSWGMYQYTLFVFSHIHSGRTALSTCNNCQRQLQSEGYGSAKINGNDDRKKKIHNNEKFFQMQTLFWRDYTKREETHTFLDLSMMKSGYDKCLRKDMIDSDPQG